MALEDAMETGATALFGEKYGEEVRVVSMGVGDAGPAGGGRKAARPTRPGRWSCAAARTLTRTGDIGLIKITAESASAAGVRRIEALTAEGAREYLAQQDARMRELAGALRTKPDDVVERVKALLEERKQHGARPRQRQAPAGARRRSARQRRGPMPRRPCARSARSS